MYGHQNDYDILIEYIQYRVKQETPRPSTSDTISIRAFNEKYVREISIDIPKEEDVVAKQIQFDEFHITTIVERIKK